MTAGAPFIGLTECAVRPRDGGNWPGGGLEIVARLGLKARPGLDSPSSTPGDPSK